MQLAEKRRKIKVLEHNSEKYKELTAEFRRKARKDKEKYLKDECKEMENRRIGGRPKDFFKKIKEITGRYTAKVGTIKSADGKDLTEDAQIKQRWQEYVEKLYERDKRLCDTFMHKEYDHQREIIVSEIEWAINELANGKSLGTDNIQVELIKAGGEEVTKAIHRLCIMIWKNNS